MEHDGCINFLTYTVVPHFLVRELQPRLLTLSLYEVIAANRVSSGPNIAIEVDRWKPPLAASLPDVAKGFEAGGWSGTAMSDELLAENGENMEQEGR
uniref:Uncharacterized protein n=1 Tax=Salix viminalis TaxID=40686 RepID=A0A6N2K3F3_SALVM